MKIIVSVLCLLLTSILHLGSKIEIKPAYDSNYVMSSSVEHQGESYCVVYMKRTDKKVRAKYFAKKLYGKRMINAIYTDALDDASPTKRLANHARFD